MGVEKIFFIRREIASGFFLKEREDLDHLPRRARIDLRLRLIWIAQHAERHVRLRDERLDEIREWRSRIRRFVGERAAAIAALRRTFLLFATIDRLLLRGDFFRR